MSRWTILALNHGYSLSLYLRQFAFIHLRYAMAPPVCGWVGPFLAFTRCQHSRLFASIRGYSYGS
jgi:hypothetical protein